MTPASISLQAIQHVLHRAVLEQPCHFVPEKFFWQHFTKNENLPPSDIEDVCNGVVHPTTGKTITKYKRLIQDPLLRDIWLEAMCRELGRLAQGYNNITGTNTIHFMDCDKIALIPKNCTINYSHIVVDH